MQTCAFSGKDDKKIHPRSSSRRGPTDCGREHELRPPHHGEVAALLGLHLKHQLVVFKMQEESHESIEYNWGN